MSTKGAGRIRHWPGEFLRRRRSGCDSAGHLWVENWPTIELEALRRTYEYSPDPNLVLRTFDAPYDLACT